MEPRFDLNELFRNIDQVEKVYRIRQINRININYIIEKVVHINFFLHYSQSNKEKSETTRRGNKLHPHLFKFE